MGKRRLTWWVMGLILCLQAQALTLAEDSLQASLLTCAPGQEVYALYGHTALRVRSLRVPERDWVFNYGVFSFGQPHFIWRFTRGECDYEIGVVDFPHFISEYRTRQSAVYEQVLNLNPQEVMALYTFLAINLRPENRTYRYNFFYDNCTTRARDCIEAAIQGEVVYPANDTIRSFRSITHLYNDHHPWAQLGNDMCLGAEADRPISQRQEMFAPYFLMQYAEQAVIRTPDGTERPLIAASHLLTPGRSFAPTGTDSTPSPTLCAWLLVAAVAVTTLLERLRRTCYWWIDVVLMTLTGVMGMVVSLLFFCSAHPTVGSNWQIIVLNPIPLLAVPRVVYCALRHQRTLYHVANAAVLMFFMIFSPLIPQDFCAVVVPLALVLWLRSCSYLFSYQQEKTT